MELVADDPALDLHDAAWPIWTRQQQCAPPQFVGGGVAQASIVSPGHVVLVTTEMIEQMRGHVEQRHRSNAADRSFGRVATAVAG